MSDILVSINCITYNHGKYIAEALDSFLMQKVNFKYEILIHDDASTDNTAEIIKMYQEKYPEIIKPILQEKNQKHLGIAKIIYTFNHMRSKGKYIAICEGDDYWTNPNKLQMQVDYLEGHPDCGMCFHSSHMIQDGDEKIKVGEIKPYNSSCISSTEDIIIGDGGFISTNSIVYRKTAMDNVPEFYFNAPVGDYPIQIITSTQKYAYYIDEVMSVYRVGVPGSWTSTQNKGKDRDLKKIKLLEDLNKMLSAINEHYDYKYIDTINNKISMNEFEIHRLQRNIKKIKDKKYKTLYNSLTFREKLGIHIRYYMPRTYDILFNIKKYVRAN